MTAWIRMLSDEEAGGDLREALALARTPHGTVDNVMRVHSLRPSTLRGHVALYRATLHDDTNTLPAWLQECIASYVSILNDCPYSLANHWRTRVISSATTTGRIGSRRRSRRAGRRILRGPGPRAHAICREAHPPAGRRGAVGRRSLVRDRARRREILEANQIIGYFNYVNRCLNGLGVTTEGDVVGYYRSPESLLVRGSAYRPGPGAAPPRPVGVVNRTAARPFPQERLSTVTTWETLTTDSPSSPALRRGNGRLPGAGQWRDWT